MIHIIFQNEYYIINLIINLLFLGTPKETPSPIQSQTPAPAKTRTKTSSSKHQHIFIKPVRTAQNGQRFIIARCTCQPSEKPARINRQRNINNIDQFTPNSPIVKQSPDQQLAPNNNKTATTSQTNIPATSSTTTNKKNSFDEYYNQRQKNTKSPKTLRHTNDCPVTYLNRLKNISHNTQMARGHSHQGHHHANLYKRQNSFQPVPSMFQSNFRFPLHFKNVYYYKSLVNLNMRLMHIRNHSNQPQVKLPLNNKPAMNNLNNLSLSCPDLNLNEVLLISSSDKKLIPLNSVNKPLQTRLLQQKLIPAEGSRTARPMSVSGGVKPLNENKTRRGSSGAKSKKQSLQEKTLANTIKNAGSMTKVESNDKMSVKSFNYYNDKILGKRLFKI